MSAPSAFLGLVSAVTDVLLAEPPLAGGLVRQGRSVPVPESAAQAIRVGLVRSRGEALYEDGGSSGDWRTQIVLELYARAAPGVGADVAIDGLLVAVFERIEASPPPAGAESWALSPDIAWDIEEAEQTLVCATLILTVRHFTGPALAPAA